ncbi:MAG: BREX-6 system phosphatase PglZ [Rivularia sp. (in: Bacteria)]|nr:BREX-6 system phosphatase PglZ [Rivularia sp. MS3]
MSELGVITSVLEKEVKKELRQHGIVVWLDKDAYYSAYVDTLVERHVNGDFFAPVIAFRGSYLEMLLALEPYCNGLDKERLLIHMPGHTEETIRKTPILELYHAGFRFRKALDTLIQEAATGRVNPDYIENYLSQGVTELATAETWLQNNLSQQDGHLLGYLRNVGLESLLDGLLDSDGVIDQAKKLSAKIITVNDLNILAEHLYRCTGMNREFLDFYLNKETTTFISLGEAFAAWLMCVEYVHDLNRSPHLDTLKPLIQISIPLRKTCEKLINYLRQRHPEIYAAKALITETHIEKEFLHISPEDLGQIDTFQREETAVLDAAIQALLTNQFDKALQWSKSRIESNSFWLGRDRNRRQEWSLIQDAATLGSKIQTSDTIKNLDSLREALEYYTTTGYQVDKAHRHFEQQRFKLLESTLPHFAQLLEVADLLRQQYRNWVDNLTEDFSKICTTEGFLPEDNLQQRTIYEQVVHPLTQTDKKIAYFIIDAFRYEMATELLEELENTSPTVTLKARYAELPTITSVGMNAIAPVNQGGKLILAGKDGFKGFKTGEYTVRTPKERVRAMSDKSTDNISKGRRSTRLLKLADVCNSSTKKLEEKCKKINLIVVHSKEIDDAGEANIGIATFETWLNQIKAAWNHLKKAGINEFIFTADHGFLLQDQTTQEKPYGSKRDPNRRYVLATEPRTEQGMTAVSLKSLKYEGQEGYLLLRKDTAVFATGKPGATFVHGGNSLQERIIPVLAISQRQNTYSNFVKYLIEAEPEREMLGYSRLKVRVKPAPEAQGVLSFAGTRTVNLALRVPERTDIQITIKDAPGAEINNQQIQIPVESDWIEILFDLKGRRDERVRVEVFHPDGIEDVAATIPQDYFNVSGALLKTEKNQTPTQESATTDWEDSFADEGIKRVFLHLQQHDSITEIELTQILGNARKVRRFSLEFEEYLQKVPFSVRIETTSNGKRYVKQK